MKTGLLIFCFSISTLLTQAQLKTTPICPAFSVDVLGGNVNEIYAKSAMGEIKTTFPCYTQVVERDSASKCTGIFYSNRDIYFYTERNYIEIGPNFKGKITPALMGASRNSLFNVLGYPKIKDINWDAFQMQYGTLILYYNKAGKINKLQISSKSTDALKLCE